MFKFFALCFAVPFALTACGPSEDTNKADKKILWDASGCAFYVRHNISDTSFVTTLKDANKPECEEK